MHPVQLGEGGGAVKIPEKIFAGGEVEILILAVGGMGRGSRNFELKIKAA